ncbi:MAG: hypothetical protein ACRDK0_06900, partial [Solirubrobacteraceae bacterium]
AKKGQEELTGAARQQAEALAIQEMLFEKSTDAQKAFAEGGGSLARKLQESKARLREMGDEILVTATPMLLSLADAVQKHVLPKLEQFVAWLSGPGKFEVAAAALGMASSFLTFGVTTLNVLSRMLRGLTTWSADVLTVASMTASALGNEGMAGKLLDAAVSVQDFGDDVASTMEDASNTLSGWNRDVDRMRDQVTLKANIVDLEQKLASAKAQLKDKNLTKERRAQIKATISQLEAAIREAKRKLNSIPDETVNVRARYVGVSVSGRNQRLLEGRALGGPVKAGMPYIVGERGIEAFVPETDGTMVPNNRLRLGGMGAAMMRQPAQPVVVQVSMQNHGVIGSKLELENWLTATMQRLNTQGRLKFT